VTEIWFPFALGMLLGSFLVVLASLAWHSLFEPGSSRFSLPVPPPIATDRYGRPVPQRPPGPCPTERVGSFNPYTKQMVCVRIVRPLTLQPSGLTLAVGRVVAIAPDGATQLIRDGVAVSASWPRRDPGAQGQRVDFVEYPDA
jgi:hypothetical protein